jgi:hypothetical protein
LLHVLGAVLVVVLLLMGVSATGGVLLIVAVVVDVLVVELSPTVVFRPRVSDDLL